MKRHLIALSLLVMLALMALAVAAGVTVVSTCPGNQGPGWKKTIDVAGAVGPKHAFDFDEGGFVVHDKATGREVQRSSTREFWRQVEPAKSLRLSSRDRPSRERWPLVHPSTGATAAAAVNLPLCYWLVILANKEQQPPASLGLEAG